MQWIGSTASETMGFNKFCLSFIFSDILSTPEIPSNSGWQREGKEGRKKTNKYCGNKGQLIIHAVYNSFGLQVSR